jgi:hypothetical protein
MIIVNGYGNALTNDGLVLTDCELNSIVLEVIEIEKPISWFEEKR